MGTKGGKINDIILIKYLQRNYQLFKANITMYCSVYNIYRKGVVTIPQRPRGTKQKYTEGSYTYYI